jgi:hypothetical protein
MPTTAHHLDWDTLPETVREFLAAVSGGAVIERGGKPVGRYVPIMPPPPDDGEWTSAKNRRRGELIDRELDGTISPEEQHELDNLTEQMRRFVDRVAPLPLEPLQKLHRQLLEKALAAQERAGG